MVYQKKSCRERTDALEGAQILMVGVKDVFPQLHIQLPVCEKAIYLHEVRYTQLKEKSWTDSIDGNTDVNKKNL